MTKLRFLIGVFIISILLSFYFSREGFANSTTLFNINGQQVDPSGNVIQPIQSLTVEPITSINSSIEPPFPIDQSNLINTTFPKSGPSPISAMTLTVFDYDKNNKQLDRFYKAAQQQPPAGYIPREGIDYFPRDNINYIPKEGINYFPKTP